MEEAFDNVADSENVGSLKALVAETVQAGKLVEGTSEIISTLTQTHKSKTLLHFQDHIEAHNMAIPARRRLIINDHVKALHHLKQAHKAMM